MQPTRDPEAPNKDGTIDHTFGDWEVPDHPKWSSVPGFPGFLYDMRGIPPGVVHPLLAEERRAYYAAPGKEPKREVASPGLVFLAGSPCIRIGGVVIRLSHREHSFLKETVKRGTLPREDAVGLLQGIATESSQGINGVVEFDALQKHRQSILRRVEREAGMPWRVLLSAAFKGHKRSFIYDEKALPTSRE